MKIATTFLFLCFLFGCKQIAKNESEINQDGLVNNGTQQKKSIYEQIIRKEEKPDSFYKKFDFKNNYTSREIIELKVDTLKITKSAFIDFPLYKISSNFNLTFKDSLNLLKFGYGRGGYEKGCIYQSPDLSFKIFTLKGQFCGVYCNPFWVSKIILSNGTKISADYFTEIENIYLMPDGKYLVLQQAHYRPASIYSVSSSKAILLCFENENITYYPFKYNYPKYNKISNDRMYNDSIYNPSRQLSLSQEHSIERERWLKYDTVTKRLHYQYGTDFRYCCNKDSAYIYSGEFKYINGEFKHIKEIKEYIKTE